MTKQGRSGSKAALAMLIFAILWTTLPQALHPGLLPYYCLEEFYTAWNLPELVQTFHHGPDAADFLERLPLNRGSSESAAGSLSFFLYLLPFVKIFGLGALSLNLAAFAVNIAFLVLAYFVGRKLFCDRFTIVLLGLLAAAPWYRAIMMSRNFYGLSAVITLASIAVLLAAMRKRKRRLYFAAGLLIGLSVYSYVVYRVVLIAAPVYCAALALASWRKGPLDKAGLRLTAWLVLGMLIAFLPSLANPANMAHNLFTGDQENPFKVHPGSDDPARSYAEVVDPLENLNVMFGSPSWWFHNHTMHTVFLGLFVLGAVLIIARRERDAGFFLMYALLALGGLILFVEWITPSRIGGLFLPFFMVAAWGMRGLAVGLERIRPELKPWASAAIVSLALFILAWPAGRAFDREAARPNPWQNLAASITDNGFRTSDILTTNKQEMRRAWVVYLDLAGGLTNEEADRLYPFLQRIDSDQRWRLELPVRGQGPYEAALMIPRDELSTEAGERFRQNGFSVDDAGHDMLLVRGTGLEIEQMFDLITE